MSAAQWLTTGRRMSRRGRRHNGEQGVVALSGNGSGHWGGNHRGLKEVTVVAVILGFEGGRRGLGADRTCVLTNS